MRTLPQALQEEWVLRDEAQRRGRRKYHRPNEDVNVRDAIVAATSEQYREALRRL